MHTSSRGSTLETANETPPETYSPIAVVRTNHAHSRVAIIDFKRLGGGGKSPSCQIDRPCFFLMTVHKFKMCKMCEMLAGGWHFIKNYISNQAFNYAITPAANFVIRLSTFVLEIQ